jgi:hypothetical protein
VTQPAEDPLVAKAFNARKHEELARAIEHLSSDEAQVFLRRLEAAIRKRKIQLTGYLAAMAAWLITMIGALLYFGSHDGSALWVFLIPFACVGAILYGFGRWSERIGAAAPQAPGRAANPGSPPRTPPPA